MRRAAGCILAIIFLVTGLLACSGEPGGKNSGKLRIVTTVFPAYDWLVNILGEHGNRAELIWLLDDGVDLHSYQPTTEDMIKISGCDLFVYIGGTSATWIGDVLKTAVNKEMVTVDLLAVLGDAVLEEETKEGMEHGHDDHDEEATAWDEHVWLSLKNAQRLTACLAEKLGELDTARAADYKRNAESYNEKLVELDARYEAAVGAARFDTLVFGDRFPFRYLAADYGLQYYAAFPGCFAEVEASFETILFLAGKLDDSGLGAIMTTETADQSVAKAVIRATASGRDYRILVLDSMQSVTAADVAAGVTYLSIMSDNLEVLKEALN